MATKSERKKKLKAEAQAQISSSARRAVDIFKAQVSLISLASAATDHLLRSKAGEKKA